MRPASFSSLLLCRALSVTEGVSLFIREHDKGYRFQGESHPFWEFVVILSGRAFITAGEQFFHMRAGDAIFHPPGEFHAIGADGTPFTFGVFSFHGDVSIPEGGRYCHLSDTLRAEFLSAVSDARRVFSFERELYFQAVLNGQDAAAAGFTNRIEHFLFECLSHPSTHSAPITQGEEHYQRLMAAVSAGVTKRMSVPEIAAAAGMSVSNAKRIFSHYAKTGLADYYHRAVAQYAYERLREGATVTEVAATLGFSDLNYFSVFYKRIMGESPRNHKKKNLIYKQNFT
ncbi:MAG: helix-turn-helix domain-containing protein [Clostridia bacterium]|nr:helix-turn-helix domain-containing protein [Clostridia bacterium]